MLRIATYNYGGVGDSLKDLLLIKKIKELLKGKCDVIHASRHGNFFKRFEGSLISKAVTCENREVFRSKFIEKADALSFDLVMEMWRIPVIEIFQEKRIRRASEVLHRYCNDCKKIHEELLYGMDWYRINQYGILLGRNFIEQIDIHNIIGITRNDRLDIPILKEENGFLEKFGLKYVNYITVNRDTDNVNGQEMKLWPTHRYVQLMKKIKVGFPNIRIVLVGRNNPHEMSLLADLDLSGKTTLGQLVEIMKYAFLHIGSEGGLVHLRHFLGGKSLVCFGPTDPLVYGYEENINLRSDICKIPCYHVVKNWETSCALGGSVPKCLNAITADQVFEAWKKYAECNGLTR